MVKLDLCQDLHDYRRAFFDTCFTLVSCSKLEDQTPPVDKPAEGVASADELVEGVASADEPAEGVKVGICQGEEGREDEEPSKPPDESSQSKERRITSVVKHRKLSPARKSRKREKTFQPASSQTKKHEST